MFNSEERKFLAKLSSPWYIEHKNNDRFEVVYRLEIIRNQIRKWEIEIADYKTQEGERKSWEVLSSSSSSFFSHITFILSRMTESLQQLLDQTIEMLEDEIKELEEDLGHLEAEEDLTFTKDSVDVED